MVEKAKGMYCTVCGTDRRFVARKVNHTLHVVLGVLTLGLWFLIYPLFGLGSRSYRCTVCGSKPHTKPGVSQV